MRKPKRIKLVRAQYQAKLDQISERMKRLSEDAYQIRLILEQIDAVQPQVPYVKPSGTDASNAPEAPHAIS